MSGHTVEPRSNVIWITADQLRQQAVGFMGDPNAHTPHLDRLASEGVVFTHAVAGSPLCCPFRGSMLTSKYPHAAVPKHEDPLPEDLPTVVGPLKEAGYHTAYIGKWHLDGFKEARGRAAMHIVAPHRRGGFDHWIGYENNNSQWDCWVHGQTESGEQHWRLPGYETDALTDLFLDHIRKHVSSSDGQQKPFFAALQVQPPHNPYTAPAQWMQRYTPGAVALRPNVPRIPEYENQARRELAGYYAMVENLDWNIGRIVSCLSELGIADHTHILFFSDHGDLLGSHGHFRKLSPYEESLRIPFLMGGGQLSRRFKRGVSDAPINHVDIAPTTLGLCGIDVPSWMDGYDYSGHRLPEKTAAPEPDSAFLQLCNETGNPVDRPWRGIVSRDGWKYAVLEGQPWMLFNLNNDPYELVNHALNPAHKGKRAHLQQRLAQWMDETDDNQFRLPNIK